MLVSGATVASALVLSAAMLPVGVASDAAPPRATVLRGSSAKARAPAMTSEAKMSWQTLGERRVADDEGDSLFTVHGDLDLCKQVCSNYPGCKSFAFCQGEACYLKDGEVNASSPGHANDYCTTYFLDAADVTTTTTTAAPGPTAPEEAECFAFKAALQMNEAQNYAGNPEAEASGSVDLFLCTNGTMLGSVLVHGAHSQLIATHIHHCEGGDSPQTRTGVLCSGPPVINFCGDNSPGLIADGTDYPSLCARADSNGTSRTEDMRGAFVPGQNGGTTLAERVRDIAANPDEYYFNVHSMASYNHFYPHHEGMCRGPLQGKSMAPATTTTLAPADGAPAENKCYSMFSQMSMNELQKYPSNPDSGASGYTDFELCTNGTLRATALLFGGVSEIIAMHIHRCEGGDTPQTRTADLCEGPPVVNFCGDNSAGLIDDGVEYLELCSPWNSKGGSRTANMAGNLVSGTASASAVAQQVEDIAQNPQLYYFNVHTLASYMHWYPHHKGMCRGPMRASAS